MASVLSSPVVDTIVSAARLVLSPLFTGPILLSLTYRPDTVRHVLGIVAEHLPQWAAASLSSLPHPPAITVLRVLVALGLLRTANRALNTMAHNSWRLTAAPGWDWPNEIAVVTGGSSGIGKGIVERLAALGVRVAVLDIQDLPKDLQGNARVRFFRCDVTSSESVAAAADAVRRELGHASILVNNAGIARTAPILQADEAFLRRILGVNLMSMWFTTQQFVPHMVQRGKGHVVTLASIASFVALATAADYSATKAGALAFHEALASELKHQHKAPHVLTTVVHPNFVRTPLVQSFEGRLQRAGVRMLTSDRVADEVVAQIKSRRGGQLVIPSSATGLSGIRGWPTWLQEFVRDRVASGAVKP